MVLSLSSRPSAAFLLLLLLCFSAQDVASLRGRGRRLQFGNDHFIMRGLADLDWSVQLAGGGARINFDSEDKEVELVYNYTGDLGVLGSYTRLLSFRLLSSDCDPENSVDKSALRFFEANGQDLTRILSGENNEIDLFLDIDKKTISGSPFYTETGVGAAEIEFCVR